MPIPLQIGVPEAGIVVVLALLLFGASRLPKLAAAIGRAGGEAELAYREASPDDGGGE